MKIRFVVWDKKEEIDPENLRNALAQVFNGRDIPDIHGISDNDSSNPARVLLLSSEEIDHDRAQKIWDQLSVYDLPDEKNPCCCVQEI